MKWLLLLLIGCSDAHAQDGTLGRCWMTLSTSPALICHNRSVSTHGITLYNCNSDSPLVSRHYKMIEYATNVAWMECPK